MNMNQQLNHLKEIMDQTIFKKDTLSSKKKQEIYENAIVTKRKKRHHFSAPVLSIALASCFILLIAGLSLTQLFYKQSQNLSHLPEPQNHFRSIIANENKEDNKPDYEETVYYLPFQNYNDPVVDGNQMFVHVHGDRNKHLDIDTFIQYNLETNDYKVLYKSSFSQADMGNTQLNEDWIMWKDFSRSGKSKIMTLNRSTGEMKKITEISGKNEALRSPTLYKEYIAWIYLNIANKEAQVHLHHLLTGETIILANLIYNPESYPTVHMGDGKLVWASHEDGKGFFYLYDLETKNKEKYEAPAPFVIYAKYSNGKIYAINSSGKVNPQEGRVTQYWDELNYGFLDIDKKEFHTIIANGKRGWFDAYDDKMVLLDTEDVLYVHEFQKNHLNSTKVPLKNEDPTSVSFDNDGNIIIDYMIQSFDKGHIENQSKVGVIREN